MTVRSLDESETVKSLAASGMNDCAIARKTGIPRRTVRDLRCRPTIRDRLAAGSSTCGIDHDFPSLPPAAYSYLLGIYLGDGCVSRGGRVWRLRITLDSRYPGIIARCRETIEVLCRASVRGLGDVPTIARKFICTRNIGRVYFPSTDRAGSI
jgi:hypothetical protein